MATCKNLSSLSGFLFVIILLSNIYFFRELIFWRHIYQESFDQWLQKWGPSMVQISKAYGKRHFEGDLFQRNGTHFMKVPQIRRYYNFIKENKAMISRICETGFHEGHSTLMWATLFDGDIDIISFDLCDKNRCDTGIKMIKSIFPKVRLTVVRGDSRATVPKFALQHPNTKCDLISIDGGHVGDVPKKDMDNMKHLAAKNNLVIVDDANTKSKLDWLIGPGKAWEKSVREKLICPLGECQQVIDPPIELMQMNFCFGKYCQK